MASTLVDLARLHLATGNYPDAGALLDRALGIQQKSLGPEHPSIALTLRSRAEVAAGSGAAIQAFEIAARAETLSREHLRLTLRTLPEQQALSSASALTSALDLMLRLASARRDDGEISRAAWNAIIRARGMVLDEMASRYRSVAAGEDKEIANLAEALASVRRRLATLTVRGIQDDPPEVYRRLLEQARNEKEQAEGALAQKSARFRNDQSRSRILLPEISSALPPASGLVGFVMYRGEDVAPTPTTATSGLATEPAYLAFILRAGDPVPVVIPLGSATKIDRLVSQWRHQVDQEATAAGRASPRAEAAYRRVAGELRAVIWDPLLPHLSSATRVFIVPDGALHLLSFAALPTGTVSIIPDRQDLVHFLQ